MAIHDTDGWTQGSCRYPIICGVICATLLCLGAGGMAMAHAQASNYNSQLVEAKCQLAVGHLTGVDIDEARCEDAMSWAGPIAKVESHENGDFWEHVPCKTSSINVSIPGNPNIFKVRNDSVIEFKRAIKACNLCASDRKTQSVGVVRVPSCVDIRGQPVQSCSHMYQDLLEAMTLQGGSFDCSYDKEDPGRVAAGKKEVMEKHADAYAVLAGMLFLAAVLVLLLGFCIGCCCVLCAPPDRDEEEADKLLDTDYSDIEMEEKEDKKSKK